jgi:hypothetical protein
MIRTLLNIPLESLISFDDVDGSVMHQLPYSPGWTGRLLRLEAGYAALYAVDDSLVFQVGRQRFHLHAGDVSADYQHEWKSGDTIFSISDGSSQWVIRYASWWSLRGIAALDVQFSPERDEEEDVLAFVFALANDRLAASKLARRWGKT